MSDGGLFQAGLQGEKGLYDQKVDFFIVFPEAVVKGAVFALDPTSWACDFLKQHVPEETMRDQVRNALVYILRTINACQRDELAVVFDPGVVNAYVFQAIMMGTGAVLMRKYNRLFRERRFTHAKKGYVNSPTEEISLEASMRLFDETLTRVLLS